jgi:hypothetical protein
VSASGGRSLRLPGARGYTRTMEPRFGVGFTTAAGRETTVARRPFEDT